MISFPFSFASTVDGDYFVDTPAITEYDELVYNDDIIGTAVDLMIAKLRDAGINEELIKALNHPYQILEYYIFDALSKMSIATANEYMLNFYGQVVGQKQYSLTADQWRTMIKARIKTNRSAGTIENILEILKLIYDTELDVNIYEYFPNAMIIQLNNVTTDAAPSDIVNQLMQLAKRATVQLGFTSLTEDYDERFLFGDEVSSTDYGLAFGDEVSSDEEGLAMELRV